MSARAPHLGQSEQQLILACARVEMDVERARAVSELVRRPLDWDAILFFARLHSVAPLLRHHLKELAGDAVPREARRGLLALHQRAAYQNRLFAREAQELIDSFHARGFPIIVQKGLLLLDHVYGNLSLRPLIDLIFLVRSDDMDAARRVLLERDYGEERLRPVPALFRWSFPQPIFKKRGGELDVAVVLQSDLVTWPRLHRFTPGSIWSNARHSSVSGREVLVPSPVDLVLYLCVQADNHGYLNRAALGSVDAGHLIFGTWSNNRLVRFVDIREVVRRYEAALDWELFVERARSTMLEDTARASLALANELGRVTPDSVLAALRLSRPRLRSWLLETAGPQTNGGGRRRLAGSAWQRLPSRHHIRLAQLLGLVELTFPRPDTLRRLDGRGARLPFPARYTLHAGRTIARSTLSFVSAVSNRGAK